LSEGSPYGVWICTSTGFSKCRGRRARFLQLSLRWELVYSYLLRRLRGCVSFTTFTIKEISVYILTVVEVFAPTPAELVKRYNAKKIQDEKYEVSAVNLPWVIYRQEVDLVLRPGVKYVIEGVQVEGLVQPWEAYVALVTPEGDFGVGYVVAQRRRMFSCIYKCIQSH
jgi:hypothetical protein